MKMDIAMYRSAIGVALATGFILLIPLLAMQLTDEVLWNLVDFVFAGTLLFGTGFTFELARRKVSDITYRVAAGVSLAAAFLLAWIELAVGVIGRPGGLTGLMELGVLAVGIIGAIIARFQPREMARAVFMMALAQALVAVIALIAGLGSAVSPWYEIVGATGIFVALFAGSGWLFRRAAREQLPAGAGAEG